MKRVLGDRSLIPNFICPPTVLLSMIKFCEDAVRKTLEKLVDQRFNPVCNEAHQEKTQKFVTLSNSRQFVKDQSEQAKFNGTKEEPKY